MQLFSTKFSDSLDKILIKIENENIILLISIPEYKSHVPELIQKLKSYPKAVIFKVIFSLCQSETIPKLYFFLTEKN
jgi:hypothetical protein